MLKTIFLLTAMLTIAGTQSVLAAKRLGPPIEDLQSTPERIRIVAAEAREKSDTGKILFNVTERLTGDAPDEVLLRTDKQSYNDVTVGQSYVVAWTYMRRNRRVIGGWEEDPEGPSTVTVMGLGSTALFEATPEMKYLFKPGTMTDTGSAARQIDALLEQMERADYRSRGLVITELYLRNDLTEQISAAQADKLKSLLQTAALDAQHRDLLYQAALHVPRELTAPWLAEDLRKTIVRHGTEYDLSSFVPGLVATAAKGLQQVGNAGDIELLSTLLYANNPGVSKAALAAIDHFDHDAAVAMAQQALERGGIHGETRSALSRYLSTGTIR